MQDKILLGDSLRFETAVTDYPASDGWTLVYQITPRTVGVAPIKLTAITATDGEKYLIEVAAGVTALWTAGEYSWTSWVELTGQRFSLTTGTCTFKPDPATALGGVDFRSDARIALDDALIAQRTWTPSTKRYRIGDREMEFNTPGDIERHISVLRSQVMREERLEEIAKGYPDRRKVYVRMSNA